MRVSFNSYNYSPVSMTSRQRKSQSKTEKEISKLLQPFYQNKEAKIPPLKLMKGINPDSDDVFDTFERINDVANGINFVKNHSQWNDCLLEEIQEFNVARLEYIQDPSQQNFDHMEEEMGDIFYTAASMAANSNINAQDAFKATNRKFYNRINLMERMAAAPESGMSSDLRECKGYERRALWNAAKRNLYAAQMKQYQIPKNQSS